MSDFTNYNLDPSICGDLTKSSPFEYESIPYDVYHVSISKLELGKSKSGYPMLKCQFRIESGPLAGKLIFMNSVLLRDGSKNDFIFVSKCNSFLRSLRMIPDAQIKLDHERGVVGYAEMVNEIARLLKEHKPTFALDYNKETNQKGNSFDTFTITDVYVE